MLFNSIHFALFFLLFAPIYFLLPHRARLAWLLAASCYFYMVLVPAYILILAFLVLLDYAAGILIEGASGRKRKLYLIASIAANLGTLGVFKYYGFFVSNLDQLFTLLGVPLQAKAFSFLLPVGLSFHTFQSLSYTVEVYRGRWKAERDLLNYSLYVMFWPQLVAGPIERPQNLLPQFNERVQFRSDRAIDGLRLMLLGFVKKVVIADGLARYANFVFDSPAQYSGWPLIVAVYCFSFQIYFDFSGYTDIARGAARILGFNMMVNFDNPYLATSVSDFWKRWHISLSTWFRDYVYIPLGGNRVPAPRRYFNLMAVFAMSGLWHGANWTFVAWGVVHGALLSLSVATEGVRATIKRSFPLPSGLERLFGIVVTFHLVSFAWIFFRAATLADAFQLIGNLFGPSRAGELSVSGFRIVLALGFCLYPWLRQTYEEGKLRFASWLGAGYRLGMDYAAVCLIYFSGVLEQQTFIYFQF